MDPCFRIFVHEPLLEMSGEGSPCVTAGGFVQYPLQNQLVGHDLDGFCCTAVFEFFHQNSSVAVAVFIDVVPCHFQQGTLAQLAAAVNQICPFRRLDLGQFRFSAGKQFRRHVLCRGFYERLIVRKGQRYRHEPPNHGIFCIVLRQIEQNDTVDHDKRGGERFFFLDLSGKPSAFFHVHGKVQQHKGMLCHRIDLAELIHQTVTVVFAVQTQHAKAVCFALGAERRYRVNVVDLTDLFPAEHLICFCVQTGVRLNGNRLKSQIREQFFQLVQTGRTAGWNPAFQQVCTASGFLTGIVCQMQQCQIQIFFPRIFGNRFSNVLSTPADCTVVGGMLIDKLTEISKRLIGIVRDSADIAAEDTAHDELRGRIVLVIDLGFNHVLAEHAEVIVRTVCQFFQLVQKAFALLHGIDRNAIADHFQQSDIEAVIVGDTGDAVPRVGNRHDRTLFPVDVRKGAVAFTEFQFIGEILKHGFEPLLCLLQAFPVLGKVLVFSDRCNVHVLSIGFDEPCSTEIVLGFHIAENFGEPFRQFRMRLGGMLFDAVQNVEIRHAAERGLGFRQVVVIQQNVLAPQEVHEEILSGFGVVCTVHLFQQFGGCTANALGAPVESPLCKHVIADANDLCQFLCHLRLQRVILLGKSIVGTAEMLCHSEPVTDAGKHSLHHCHNAVPLAALDFFMRSGDVLSLILDRNAGTFPEIVNALICFFHVQIFHLYRLIGTNEQFRHRILDKLELVGFICCNDVQTGTEFTFLAGEQQFPCTADLSVVLIHIIPHIRRITALLRLINDQFNDTAVGLIGSKRVHAVSGFFAERYQIAQQGQHCRIGIQSEIFHHERKVFNAVIRYRRRMEQGMHGRSCKK